MKPWNALFLFACYIASLALVGFLCYTLGYSRGRASVDLLAQTPYTQHFPYYDEVSTTGMDSSDSTGVTFSKTSTVEPAVLIGAEEGYKSLHTGYEETAFEVHQRRMELETPKKDLIGEIRRRLAEKGWQESAIPVLPEPNRLPATVLMEDGTELKEVVDSLEFRNSEGDILKYYVIDLQKANSDLESRGIRILYFQSDVLTSILCDPRLVFPSRNSDCAGAEELPERAIPYLRQLLDFDSSFYFSLEMDLPEAKHFELIMTHR